MFQSLYGNTEPKKDVVTGQLFYEGNLLSPSEILLLVSYVNDQCLLCPSLTVEEAVSTSIQLNSPLWVWEAEEASEE